MRAVLDMFVERKNKKDLLEENARLVTERDDAKKRVPLLQHQSRVDFARLKKLVRELRAPDHIDEVFFQQVKNRLTDRKKSAETNYRDAVTQLKLPKLRQNRDNKSTELGRIQNELTNLRASRWKVPKTFSKPSARILRQNLTRFSGNIRARNFTAWCPST